MKMFAVSLSLCLWIPIHTLAWNAEGHMVVAKIAYNHLDAPVKSRCDALIAVTLTNASTSTSNFVTAAVWADDFKAALGTSTSHYIDLPFSLDGTSTNGFVPPTPDVVIAIRSNIATLQSTNATLVDQATSLRYLLHFVGDIQQPLHCSTAMFVGHTGGDAGGNGFTLIGGNWSNLHSLWDAGGGYLSNSYSRPLSIVSQNTISNRAALIEIAQPYIRNTGTITDPQVWANAGVALAQTNTYVGITNNSAPTQPYLNTAQATTQQLMAQGGYRLANLLNTILAANPFSLTSVTKTNGSFRFSWSANEGKIFRVQWKQQLNAVTWTDLTNITATGTTVSFTESAGQQQRFYRVIQLN